MLNDNMKVSCSTTCTTEMKVFESIRNYFHIFGIDPWQANQCSLNIFIRWTMLATLFYGLISTTVSLLVENETFQEYNKSFYGCVSTFVFVIFGLIIVLKRTKVAEVIESFDEIIQTSELKIGFFCESKECQKKKKNCT